MAGWLSRATSLFQQPPTPPEPFEVECDCGGKVVGQRINVYQKPTCPVCERPVFVLPANVYPCPPNKSKLKTKVIHSPDGSKSNRSSVSTVVDGEPTSVVSKSGLERAAQLPLNVERSLPREPSTPLMTPLRMVVVAIILMSALTVGGLWRRYRFENAKATILQANDAGLAAIDKQDFSNAARELDRARKAVDVLGRTDQAANDIRRLSREATALAGLATSSLTEILQDTLANAKPGQSEEVRMSSVDKGAWVLFDARVLLASEGKDRYLIDAPILFNEGIVQIEIESSIFREIPKLDDSGEAPRFIFAAQLDQLSPFKGEPLASVLRLNGKTAFLWSSYDIYKSMGYRPVDAESELQTRIILERQIEIQRK